MVNVEVPTKKLLTQLRRRSISLGASKRVNICGLPPIIESQRSISLGASKRVNIGGLPLILDMRRWTPLTIGSWLTSMTSSRACNHTATSPTTNRR